jgi:hypothetical protein
MFEKIPFYVLSFVREDCRQRLIFRLQPCVWHRFALHFDVIAGTDAGAARQ